MPWAPHAKVSDSMPLAAQAGSPCKLLPADLDSTRSLSPSAGAAHTVQSLESELGRPIRRSPQRGTSTVQPSALCLAWLRYSLQSHAAGHDRQIQVGVTAPSSKRMSLERMQHVGVHSHPGGSTARVLHWSACFWALVASTTHKPGRLTAAGVSPARCTCTRACVKSQGVPHGRRACMLLWQAARTGADADADARGAACLAGVACVPRAITH